MIGRFRLANGIRFTTGVGHQIVVSKRHCFLIALRDSPFWFVTGCDVFGVLGIGHERWEIISRNVRARSKSGRGLSPNIGLAWLSTGRIGVSDLSAAGWRSVSNLVEKAVITRPRVGGRRPNTVAISGHGENSVKHLTQRACHAPVVSSAASVAQIA